MLFQTKALALQGLQRYAEAFEAQVTTAVRALRSLPPAQDTRNAAHHAAIIDSLSRTCSVLSEGHRTTSKYFNTPTF